MKTTHMSTWDQEEYALGQRTPEMIQHLTHCAACRASVEQLLEGVALFRTSAMDWTAECLKNAPAVLSQNLRPTPHTSSTKFTPPLRWALAALLLLLVLLPLSRLLMHHNAGQVAIASAPKPALSDDALLQEIDQQVSDAVPDSMESLTHLVTTKNESGQAAESEGGRQNVQRN